MSKYNKDGKTSNITIRITEKLREKLEALWGKNYSAMPFNAFLGYLVDMGAREEEYIEKYRETRAKEKENNQKQPNYSDVVTGSRAFEKAQKIEEKKASDG